MKLIITPHKGYPRGIKCGNCKKVSQPGQVILWESIKNVGHFVWHRDCMNGLLESEPKLLHKDQVYDKLQNIAGQYAEGNFFNE